MEQPGGSFFQPSEKNQTLLASSPSNQGNGDRFCLLPHVPLPDFSLLLCCTS